ncbi:MAG: thioredoxin-dependent thiol peroxidase [Ardenticatenaceae bacterium]
MARQTLQKGDMAPEFELMTDRGRGQKVRLSDFRGRRVILYFYPRDDTRGCTRQACGFRDHYPIIKEKNAVVLGVSPDGVESHQKFKSKYNLPFTLLVDQDHAVADAYGVWGEKSAFGRKYIGIIRSQFVIDEEGRLADVQLNVRAANSAERAVNAL